MRRHRRRLRDLLRPDRDRRPGAGVHRHLPRARASRSSTAPLLLDETITVATVAGLAPDPRRLLARRRGRARSPVAPRQSRAAARRAVSSSSSGPALERRRRYRSSPRAPSRISVDPLRAELARSHSNGPRGWLSPSRIAVSMSAGSATPSSAAKQASLTSWETTRSSTRSPPPRRRARPRARRIEPLAVAVLVEAAARLAAEPPGGDHPLLDRVRLPARLGPLAIEGARDLEVDVDPDQVHELERPHPEAAVLAQTRSICVVVGDALVEDPQRLEREGAVAAVDDEAGRVAGSGSRCGPSARRHRSRVARARSAVASPATTSTSLISAGGLKKCMPQTRSRALGLGGDRGHRERGGVGGQHRVGPAGRREPAEQLALELEVLGGGLDHQVAPAKLVERGGRWQRGRPPPRPRAALQRSALGAAARGRAQALGAARRGPPASGS